MLFLQFKFRMELYDRVLAGLASPENDPENLVMNKNELIDVLNTMRGGDRALEEEAGAELGKWIGSFLVDNGYEVQVEIDSMKSQGRARNITFPRQIAMYLARELTNLSLPDIGRNFGGRDHSTVLHACKKVEQIQQKDLSVKKSLTQLRELIKA